MNCDCLTDKNANEYIVVKFKVLLDWQNQKSPQNDLLQRQNI